MKILWLTWKDSEHPLSGGAEVVNEELAKRLADDGHEVVFLVGGFAGGAAEDARDGFSIIRMGSRISVYWKAYRYYKRHLSEWPDLILDEVNTVPFFAKFYGRQKNILFVHQLCREIWLYQMVLPLSLLGYLLEPLYLWLLNDREVVTVSESTKKDLLRYGFSPDKVHIISEGIELEPVASLAIKKYPMPTILAFGAVRPMKRTHHIVKAFEILKKTMPDARLIVAGSLEGRYGRRVERMIRDSIYTRDIQCLGKVDAGTKIELMQKSHVLAVASVKEGWGLVITEAASQGTPAVVYDADGLRDSVRDGETGLVAEHNTPADLAMKLNEILRNTGRYARIRENAWEWSKTITFDESYRQFADILTRV